MSPILVRPVREQLEHDRIIRLLHSKSRRRFEVGMNPGNEHNAPVGTGATSVYPDLVLVSQERGKKLQAVVEVETGESVNHLEAWRSGRPSRGCVRRFIYMCRPEWSMLPAGCVKTTRLSSTSSGATTRSVTRSGSPWCTGRGKARLRKAVSQRPRDASPLRPSSGPRPKPRQSARSRKRRRGGRNESNLCRSSGSLATDAATSTST